MLSLTSNNKTLLIFLAANNLIKLRSSAELSSLDGLMEIYFLLNIQEYRFLIYFFLSYTKEGYGTLISQQPV